MFLFLKINYQSIYLIDLLINYLFLLFWWWIMTPIRVWTEYTYNSWSPPVHLLLAPKHTTSSTPSRDTMPNIWALTSRWVTRVLPLCHEVHHLGPNNSQLSVPSFYCSWAVQLWFVYRFRFNAAQLCEFRQLTVRLRTFSKPQSGMTLWWRYLLRSGIE